MSDERVQLEQQLLRNPFDLPLRTRYADLLESLGEAEQSRVQWQLISQQETTRAEPLIRAALCSVMLNDAEGAARFVQQARGRPDFDADDVRLQAANLVPKHAQPALRLVQGEVKAQAMAEVISISRAPKVRFSDIIGMEELKKVVRLRIVEPFLRPGLFQRFKKSAGGGVLLYGPPGCGKTMMARAIASECQASFIAIGISDILNMWVGSSERNLAAIFDKARSEAPAVLFFDELDALAYSRSKAQSDHTRTLVNEFLNQLDGMSGFNERVLILGATNMPWDVDDAMKRPGRFDRQVFVPPPDAAARADMLQAKLRDVPCGPIDYPSLAKRSNHFSGADMDGLIERAKDAALGEILESGQERPLSQADFEEALVDNQPTTLDWLKTARNLVKFGGGGAYKDVEKYLRDSKLF